MTQDDSGTTRRGFIKAVTTLGIGSLAGCSSIGNGDAQTIEIPGYENRAQFETHERILSQKKRELPGIDDDYDDAKANSEIDSLLVPDVESSSEEGGVEVPSPKDIRVGLGGEVSNEPDNVFTTNPDLNGLVDDPEYILSTSGEGDEKTLVDQDGTGETTQQVFTSFSSGTLDVQGVIDGIQEEYGLLDQDVEAAEAAVENLADLNVLVAADTDFEQPVGSPEALRTLSQDIDEALSGLEEVYHEAKDAMAEVDQYQNALASGIESAENTADGNDKIKGFGYLEPSDGEEPLLDRTGAVASSYNQLTMDIATDIAALEATKRVLDKAYDRASAIEDAAGDVADRPRPSDGSGPHYENLEELNDATSNRDLTRSQVESFADSEGYEDVDSFDFQYSGGAVDVLTEEGTQIGTIPGNF